MNQWNEEFLTKKCRVLNLVVIQKENTQNSFHRVSYLFRNNSLIGQFSTKFLKKATEECRFFMVCQFFS